MTITRRTLAIALLSLSATLPAWSAGASKADAQSQVSAAIAHYKKAGHEPTIKDLNTSAEWKTKGMNVIVTDFKGVVLASSLNDKLVGKNTYEIKDPAGKAFVKEFISTAQKGEGWIDYQFINPESKKLEERSMFVKRLPGFDGFVGVAITKQ